MGKPACRQVNVQMGDLEVWKIGKLQIWEFVIG